MGLIWLIFSETGRWLEVKRAPLCLDPRGPGCDRGESARHGRQSRGRFSMDIHAQHRSWPSPRHGRQMRDAERQCSRSEAYGNGPRLQQTRQIQGEVGHRHTRCFKFVLDFKHRIFSFTHHHLYFHTVCRGKRAAIAVIRVANFASSPATHFPDSVDRSASGRC